MATAASVNRRRPFRADRVIWVVFGLMTLLVLYTRERTLLDPQSFLRQRYAPIPWLMFGHGIPGAVALILGVFQFSGKLRQRYLNVHRWLGRIYVGCVLVSAPMAIAVSMTLPVPTLFTASIIQSFGWIATTLTGLYCVRTGRIQLHREWMIRSYPFAAVFIVARAIQAIPAVQNGGVMALVEVVWGAIAVAAFLPSFVISWQALAASRRNIKTRAATAGI